MLYKNRSLRGDKLNQYSLLRRQTAAAAIALLLGASAGAAVSAALLAVSALIFVKAGSVPLGAAPLVTSLIGAAGAFTAGYLTVGLCKSRGMLMGSLSGLMLFCAVLIGAAVSSNTEGGPAIAAKCAIFLIGGAIGGIVRVNRRVKVKSHK